MALHTPLTIVERYRHSYEVYAKEHIIKQGAKLFKICCPNGSVKTFKFVFTPADAAASEEERKENN